MRRGLVAIAAVALFVTGAAADESVDGVTFLGATATDAEIALGKQLYSEHCASCHGADLEGQPHWRRRLPTGRMPAPPHDKTGHTWHHSDSDLFTMTKLGVAAIVPDYESDMPAFEGVLNDPEIKAVLIYIKSTWPERQQRAQNRLNAEGGS